VTPALGSIIVVQAQDRVWPAVVQTVNKDGSVDAGVFRGKHFVEFTGLTYGTKVNEWQWPEPLASDLAAGLAAGGQAAKPAAPAAPAAPATG
jgi:hypothetical protein